MRRRKREGNWEWQARKKDSKRVKERKGERVETREGEIEWWGIKKK